MYKRQGLITLEDLLEEIVGNIYDEFDPVMEPKIEKVDENLWRFPGDTPVELSLIHIYSGVRREKAVAGRRQNERDFRRNQGRRSGLLKG